jgi:hypothetical protein
MSYLIVSEISWYQNTNLKPKIIAKDKNATDLKI